jgi:cell division protein FtsB
MPRRIQNKPSILEPAGDLLRKISDSDSRLRRRILRGSLVALGVWFALSLLFGTYSVPRIVRLNLERDALTESNRQLTVDLIDAARVRDLLRSDPTYIEAVARTDYFMVRPHEIIYRYRSR